jgi:hypothetical protein
MKFLGAMQRKQSARAAFADDAAERRRDRREGFDFITGEKLTGLDFLPVDDRLVVAMKAVNPNKLPAGLVGGRELEEPAEVPAGDGESEFFPEFADRAGIVVLPACEVAGGAGVVVTGEGVLGRGAFLDKQLALEIEHENVNRPVAEVAGVDLTARGLTDDPVRLVHHIENLVKVLHCRKRKAPGRRGLLEVSCV